MAKFKEGLLNNLGWLGPLLGGAAMVAIQQIEMVSNMLIPQMILYTLLAMAAIAYLVDLWLRRRKMTFERLDDQVQAFAKRSRFAYTPADTESGGMIGLQIQNDMHINVHMQNKFVFISGGYALRPETAARHSAEQLEALRQSWATELYRMRVQFEVLEDRAGVNLICPIRDEDLTDATLMEGIDKVLTALRFVRFIYNRPLMSNKVAKAASEKPEEPSASQDNSEQG